MITPNSGITMVHTNAPSSRSGDKMLNRNIYVNFFMSVFKSMVILRQYLELHEQIGRTFCNKSVCMAKQEP